MYVCTVYESMYFTKQRHFIAANVDKESEGLK